MAARKRTARKTVKLDKLEKLRRVFEKARKREADYLDALPRKAKPAQFAKGWALADGTNKALRAWSEENARIDATAGK